MKILDKEFIQLPPLPICTVSTIWGLAQLGMALVRHTGLNTSEKIVLSLYQVVPSEIEKDFDRFQKTMQPLFDAALQSATQKQHTV